jgi:protein-disulfide isomerase
MMKMPTDTLLRLAVVLVGSSALILTGFNVKREIEIRKPSAPIRIVPDWKQYITAGHRIGSDSAKVTVVVFSDYQCPACNAAFSDLAAIRRGNEDNVAVILRHYPIAQHVYANAAARAAVCADGQGRFEQMNTLLFLKADSFAVQSFADIAAVAGVPNIEEFTRCMDDPNTVAVVAGDVAAGTAINVTATPTFVINGVQYTGALGVKAIVKQHLGQSSTRFKRSQAVLN